MDGTLADGRELGEHLAQCADCRAELRALQQIEAALREVVQHDVPEHALDRLSAGVMPAVAARQAQPAPGASLRWAIAGAMAVAALCVGLAAGRWLWPRELTVTRVLKVPEVQEKIVEVKVPVVEERVVVKPVPVVKTQVVYRDREVPAAMGLWGKPVGPVKLDPIVVRLATTPTPPAPTLRQQVRPAALAGEGEE
jgi:anti-sigma factor RsiW